MLESIFHSELPVLVADELQTVMSVVDCWNTISCKVGWYLPASPPQSSPRSGTQLPGSFGCGAHRYLD